MPNQDDQAFLDPDGDHVVVPAGVNDRSSPLRVTEREINQGSSMAFSNPDDDHVAEVVVKDKIPAPPKIGQGEDAREHRAYYSCRHCDLLFPSAQALGGHQNGHRNVRDYAKRLKRNEDMALSYSSLGNTQPNYGDYPYSAIGYPQLGDSFFKPTVPKIQNPRSTTEFTVGRQSGQSSVMFNSTQLPVYGRAERIYPYSGNYGNSIRSADNSKGTVGGSENGSTNVGLLRPYENSRISAGVFEAAGTNAGTSRNIFELISVGGPTYNETQDMFRGHNGSDGTVDLLSRVGVGSGEDAETTDTHGGN